MVLWRFIAILSSLVLAQATAVAQSPPAPTFVYNITMGGGPGSGSMDYKMNVAITSTSPDGSRTAAVTMNAPKMPPVDKKTFDATITPFGVINIGSTGEMPKGGYSPFDMGKAKQAAQAAQAPMLQMMLDPMNTFAGGLSKAPSFKTGATWQAQSGVAMTTITYTVTGHEQRNGRDTAIITMKSAPNGASVTGQGNYDPAGRLVVAAHCEIRQSADAKEAQVLDLAMSNP